MFEKLFHLKENGTDVRTEVLAGLTTFLSMAYILAVNPNILSAAGMGKESVLVATAVASFAGCIAMALLANYPFALAPGLGLNAYFAYTICLSMGYSYNVALLAVLVEGLIFIALSLSGFREVLVNSIPMSLKRGITVAIGMFVAFIGLQGANIIVPDSATIVTLTSFRDSFGTYGISAVLCIVGLLLTCLLSVKKVRASVIIGVLTTWVLGIIMQLAGVYTVSPETGFYSLLPDLSGFGKGIEMADFGACFKGAEANIGVVDMIIMVFALLYMDMFDTMGTLVGLAGHTGMLDEKGRLPRAKQAMLADAIATTVGAVFGTSTTTTFVESSAGVEAGGRTGLTAAVTGFMFLLCIFLAPIFTAIPSFATAPALIYVGLMMTADVANIDLRDIREGMPAFLCILVMVLSYSISDGIAFGVISYTVINLICGGKEKRPSGMMIALSVIFLLKYIFL